ncbi:spore germination protein [Hathewaya histolytica]|uniref:Spore germination protein KA n=1 Tax=Hathewaya histolytica TaxID=1498 RepID=A0A4U9RKI0_HATHI|nr:spore germination protein [Hathewaya histolytica]VTQ91113.1 spore germination protein KA [Hathewaya histolytica]
MNKEKYYGNHIIKWKTAWIGSDFMKASSKNNKGNEDGKISNNNIDQYNLHSSLQENIDLFKNVILKNNDTVIYREFRNKKSSQKFCLIFLDGMVNREVINENILYPLINDRLKDEDKDVIKYIEEEVVIVDDVKEEIDLDKLLTALLYGDSLLLVDGSNSALILNTKGWETRSISEPQSETVVNGPREGFNESINTNKSLIRRKVTSPHLKFESREIGSRTKTKISVAYVDGIVNPKILKELKKRLNKIDIEGIFSSETIREYINDNPLSPFATIGKTERPDVVASKLLQGRIAILCDGSPVVLTLPFLFLEYFQVNEDYYDNFIYASINRLLRVLAFILTIGTPAIYIAFTTFHKEMIPTKLALSIYMAKEGVPLPASLEAIIMLITFEIIREAGIRLPKHIGAAISIVGALVLGDAAVNAKFVSAPIVIVTAIAGISELIVYEMRAGVIVSRFIFLILASFLGIYGVIFVGMGLTIHLMSMKSFGIPYMLKLIDLDKYNIRDTAIRFPWWALRYRTKFISEDIERSKKYIKRRNM